MSVGLPPDEYLDILKEHFHVTHINDVASLKFLSEHDYGEEDEPDFTLEQKRKLHASKRSAWCVRRPPWCCDSPVSS